MSNMSECACPLHMGSPGGRLHHGRFVRGQAMPLVQGISQLRAVRLVLFVPVALGVHSFYLLGGSVRFQAH